MGWFCYTCAEHRPDWALFEPKECPICGSEMDEDDDQGDDQGDDEDHT